MKGSVTVVQFLHMYNNFIFAGWAVFNRKINIFEIINLQLSYLDKSVYQPANFKACYLMCDYRMSHA